MPERTRTEADDDVDPRCCPLCGDGNECGAVKGESTCWCCERTIAKGILDRIPVAARGKACICSRCAGDGAHSAWDAETSGEDSGKDSGKEAPEQSGK